MNSSAIPPYAIPHPEPSPKLQFRTNLCNSWQFPLNGVRVNECRSWAFNAVSNIRAMAYLKSLPCSRSHWLFARRISMPLLFHLLSSRQRTSCALAISNHLKLQRGTHKLPIFFNGEENYFPILLIFNFLSANPRTISSPTATVSLSPLTAKTVALEEVDFKPRRLACYVLLIEIPLHSVSHYHRHLIALV